MDVFNLFQEFYGIPNAVTLGIFLTMIAGPIVVATRSMAHLAILGIYIISVVGTTFVNDTYLEPQYHTMLYVIVLAAASVVVLLVLKVIKE